MKRRLTHALTLRITSEMDSMIADAAYDARTTSKAEWIRWAIERTLRKLQPKQEPVLR